MNKKLYLDQSDLYLDQTELDAKIRHKIGVENIKALAVQAETGSGKTIIAANLINGAFKKGKTAHFVVPRRELMRQTAFAFDKFGIDYSYIASLKEKQDKNIYICSKDTLKNRLDFTLAPDFAIIDEFHHGGKSVNNLIQWYKGHGTIIIGLTATPILSSGAGFEHQFEDMVFGKSLTWLIENKRLSEYKFYAPSERSYDHIPKVGGNWHKGAMGECMNADQAIIGNCVREYKEKAMGLRGITFCYNRQHSMKVVENYKKAGVPAVHMDCDTPEGERVRIAKAVANREILQICNVDLCTFGYDLSAASGYDANIECMSDLQPTKSLSKQRQKNGRNLRYDGKTHLFFDYVSNYKEHGLPCDDKEWTLKPTKIRGKAVGERITPTSRCPKCSYCHPPAPSCPNDLCRYYLEKGERYLYPVMSKTIEEIEGELVALDIAKIKKETRDKQIDVGSCKDVDELLVVAQKYKYKAAWVLKRAEVKKMKVDYRDLLKIKSFGGYNIGWVMFNARRMNIRIER